MLTKKEIVLLVESMLDGDVKSVDYDKLLESINPDSSEILLETEIADRAVATLRLLNRKLVKWSMYFAKMITGAGMDAVVDKSVSDIFDVDAVKKFQVNEEDTEVEIKRKNQGIFEQIRTFIRISFKFIGADLLVLPATIAFTIISYLANFMSVLAAIVKIIDIPFNIISGLFNSAEKNGGKAPLSAKLNAGKKLMTVNKVLHRKTKDEKAKKKIKDKLQVADKKLKELK